MLKSIRLWIFKLLFKNKLVDIAILLAMNAYVHRSWFTKGVIVLGDWSYFSSEFMANYLNPPYCWTTRFFSGAQFMLFGWPLQWVMGLIANLGFDYGVAERAVYFFPFLVLSVIGVYYLTNLLFKNRIINFFSTLFFIFNIQILVLVLFNRLVAYALMPFVLAFFIKSLKEKPVKNGLLTGLFLILTVAYEPQVAYLVMFPMFLFWILSIYEVRRIKNGLNLANLSRYAVPPIIALSTLFILSFYWFYPSLVAKGGYMVSGYNSSGWVNALSYFKFHHVLNVYVPWWPTGKNPNIVFYLVPILVFLPIFLKPKDFMIRFLTILAIVSVFLAKGSNFPFGQVYIWLFKHIPGFDSFRDPGKFYLLISLAYAPLFGLGVYLLGDYFVKMKIKLPGFLNAIKKTLLFFIIFLAFIYMIWPAIIGKVGQVTLAGGEIPSEYKKIEEFIKSQPSGFRTFWRPHNSDFAYYNDKFPLIRAHYSSSPLHFFLSDIWNPDAFKGTNDIAKILGILNIKYCFLASDQMANFGLNADFCRKTFLQQNGIEKINLVQSVDVFKNKYFIPQFFASTHSALIVGDRRSLLRVAAFSSIDFSKWALFLVDDLKSDSVKLLNNTQRVIFNQSTLMDFVLAGLDDQYRFDLSLFVHNADDGVKSRWVKVDVFPAAAYYDAFGQTVFNNGGTIYGNPSYKCKLKKPVSVKINTTGEYQIWLRVALGPDRGKISIKEIKQLKREVLKDMDLKDSRPIFKWIKAENVNLKKGKACFQIIGKDGVGLVDQLIVVPSSVINDLSKSLADQLSHKDVILMSPVDSETFKFVVPVKGAYKIALKIAPKDYSGKITILLNGNPVKVTDLISENKLDWIETEVLELDANEAVVSVASQGSGEMKFKEFVVYKGKDISSSINNLFEVNETIPVEFRMIDPTKYTVKLKVEKPTYLNFSDLYDSRWQLKIDGLLQSKCAYSLINSFLIEKPQEINTTIEFSPQAYVYKGLKVSGYGLVLIGVCFIGMWIIYLTKKIIKLLRK